MATHSGVKTLLGHSSCRAAKSCHARSQTGTSAGGPIHVCLQDLKLSRRRRYPTRLVKGRAASLHTAMGSSQSTSSRVSLRAFLRMTDHQSCQGRKHWGVHSCHLVRIALMIPMAPPALSCCQQQQGLPSYQKPRLLAAVVRARVHHSSSSSRTTESDLALSALLPHPFRLAPLILNICP